MGSLALTALSLYFDSQIVNLNLVQVTDVVELQTGVAKRNTTEKGKLAETVGEIYMQLYIGKYTFVKVLSLLSIDIYQ